MEFDGFERVEVEAITLLEALDKVGVTAERVRVRSAHGCAESMDFGG